MARASAGRWVARLLVALLALFVLVQAWFAAQVLWVRWQPPRETAFMAQRLAELRAKDPKATIKFQWVPYERISTHLKRAVIAAEDAKFLEHEGFDWEGIAKAREERAQGPRRRGRVDDHAAAREEPVPVAVEVLRAQGPGSDHRADAGGVRKNLKPFLAEGLFRYSRRPNYFGETLVWWGIATMVLPLPFGYLGLVGPITITYIVTRITGPMLEKIFIEKYNTPYVEYMKQTSYFIPLPPKQVR